MHISSSSSEKRSTTSPMATGCLFSSADVNPWPASLPLGAPEEAGSTEPSILLPSFALFGDLRATSSPLGCSKRNEKWQEKRKRCWPGKKGQQGPCEIDSESQTQYRTTTRTRPPVPRLFQPAAEEEEEEEGVKGEVVRGGPNINVVQRRRR